MDKRGLGVFDYNGMVIKFFGCRLLIFKEFFVDRFIFFDKVWIWVVFCLFNKRCFLF